MSFRSLQRDLLTDWSTPSLSSSLLLWDYGSVGSGATFFLGKDGLLWVEPRRGRHRDGAAQSTYTPENHYGVWHGSEEGVGGETRDERQTGIILQLKDISRGCDEAEMSLNCLVESVGGAQLSAPPPADSALTKLQSREEETPVEHLFIHLFTHLSVLTAAHFCTLGVTTQ